MEKVKPHLEHKWVCMLVSGSQGEIRVTSAIPDSMAEEVIKDFNKAAEICPEGMIVCKIGGEKIGTDEKFDIIPNLVEVGTKLVN